MKQTPTATPGNAEKASELPPLTQKLMGIAQELTRIMEEETPLIAAGHFARQSELVKRKQELTLDYQAILKCFTENPASLSSLNDAQKKSLRATGQELDAATRKNGEALKSAYQVGERLMQAVMEEIRRDMLQDGGYSKRGVMAGYESHKAKPVSFNERA
jgi:flagellar biosynthesis/type III secretory pathway chaperone